MTDYELASLLMDVVNAMGGSLANFMTGAFAMLAAGYLVAHHLDRVAATLVSVVYTIFCVGMFFEAWGLGTNMALLTGEIASQAGMPGSSLDWHPAATGHSTEHVRYTAAVVYLMIFVGTMWFFFRMRATGGAGFQRASPQTPAT